MELRILGWSYEGIRGVGNLEISLCDSHGRPFPASLIMMPNGTGKTTTMKLLRAVFDGQADTWTASDVRSFRPTASTARRGTFRVTLVLDNTRYVVYLHMDYEQGTASYSTSRAGDRGGLDDGLKLPRNVTDAFSTEFVKRFVFDGELARQILESGKDAAERAIKYLYKLDQLEQLTGAVDRIVSAEQQLKNSTAKTMQGLAKLRTDSETAKRTLTALEREHKTLTVEQGAKAARLAEIGRTISGKLKNDQGLSARVRQLEQERAHNQQLVKARASEGLEQIRDPYLLNEVVAKKLTVLANSMQRLKLPRTMSSQFFEDLAEHERCICGRNIGPQERDYIRSHAANYLAEDQIGAMNHIKSALRDRRYSDELTDTLGQLTDGLAVRHKLNRDWDRLTVQLAEKGDTEIDQLKAEQESLIARLGQLSERLQDLATTDKVKQAHLGWLLNIPKCKEEAGERARRFAEATETLTLMGQANRTKAYIQSIQDSAMHALKRKILQATNNKVSFILRREQIQVDTIDKHLVLKGKGGVSEGQSLAVAYSYLGSLFEGAAYSLPFIVDTPAGPLDLDVRRNVSTVLPALFKQLIVFITSGEREGFADHYYGLGSNAQFLTIAAEIDSNATCIDDMVTFQAFQSEDSTSKGA